MRITFENNTQQNTERIPTSYGSTRAQEREKTGAYTADISGTVMDNNAYGVHGRTTEEVMQEAQLTDVSTQSDYMAVMSNSMSTQDFSRMLKEGANPNDTDIETVVTIVDRIKAELVKSGVSVTGYTDTLDRQTLTQIVGSEALAGQLQEAFAQNDIPVTRENIEAAADALREAGQLRELSDGEMKYLVTNNMEPTIENLYMAEHSGAVDADRQGRGYYQEAHGYYAKKADSLDFEKLLPQVEKILAEAGLEVTHETTKQAEWMVEKGIPLTKENLLCLYKNHQISLPIKEKTAAVCVAAALADGKRPVQANLTERKSKYQKAAEVSEYVERLLQDSGLSLGARRRLEEARLRMSAEVNVRLIESGFSIDTSDMESFIEALKEAETKQAERLFPKENQETAAKKLHLYQETLAQTELLPTLPAATLSRVLFEEKLTINVENLAHEGSRLKEEYQKAGQAYETLMTVPRRDLGDSIHKAFANVDDILNDLGWEITEENERAVRILSYNQIAITLQNLEQVRSADRRVQRVIDKMTPVSTLKMIRDGVNPLTTAMEDMEQYFQDQADQPEQEMETYSRYLYRMEKNQEITPEERDAYIGVYRLLRQIEKSDGAVIGSVLKAQSELSFKQLLTAARTAKRAGMNLLVDETFGGLEKIETESKTIDEQLQEIDRQMHSQEAEQVRNLTDKESEVIRTLNRLDIPVTVNQILAASATQKSAMPLFKYVKKQLKKEKVESFSDKLTEALTDKDTMQEAYREFGGSVTELLKESLYQPGQTSVDIKAMKSACMQMSIAVKKSYEEMYDIPVEFPDGTAAIRLTIRHQDREQGQAVITLESEEFGKINAFLQVRQNEVSGYVTARPETADRLNELTERMQDRFETKGLHLQDFKVISEEAGRSFKKLEETQDKVTSRTIYEAAKIVIRTLRDVL